MIKPAREDEIEAVCNRIAAIDPWKLLGILGNELVRGLQIDPLRKLYVYRSAAETEPEGAIILRERHAAELLFFRGFGASLASRHGVNYPCEWSAIPDAGYIGSLAVLGNNTGRGVGQKMIDMAHEEFRRHGHGLSYLMVSGFNVRARQFYERNGYRQITHVDDCIRPGNREHLMEKTL